VRNESEVGSKLGELVPQKDWKLASACRQWGANIEALSIIQICIWRSSLH
jgi:hypothetical protein